jgi:hypothetical protein
MRYLTVLPVLALVACSSDGLSRNFTLSRDSAQETMASTQMPLSMPPDLMTRPTRAGIVAPPSGDAQATTEQPAGSTGQDALVQAAGPAAPSDIRTEINENNGLTYPGPELFDRLMNWTPPPGHTPVITPAPQGGWLSRIF